MSVDLARDGQRPQIGMGADDMHLHRPQRRVARQPRLFGTPRHLAGFGHQAERVVERQVGVVLIGADRVRERAAVVAELVAGESRDGTQQVDRAAGHWS